MSKRASKALAVAMATGMSVSAFTFTHLLRPWEGHSNVAYWDAIGKVWTICGGITGPDIVKGLRLTDAECVAREEKLLETKYIPPLRKCMPGFDTRVPYSVRVAFIDLSWNLGPQGVCDSTAAKRANKNDWPGACQAMTWFDKSKGVTVRGLQLRRQYGDETRMGEYEICMAGLKK